MYTNGQYKDPTPLRSVSYQYIGRDKEHHTETGPILSEHLMDVYINGQLTMKLVCIPQFLTELVLGRLLTEGIIQSTGEVGQIQISRCGSQAKVRLARTEKKDIQKKYIETTPSSCTGNHILNDHFQEHGSIQPVTPIPWDADQIFALADRFAEGMPLHRETWATHSCFLAKRGELLFGCEDIGRHNAMDKAIGYALCHDIDLKGCIIYSSGRIPTDMAIKAIRAGVPILASKASPSMEAVALAKEYGLTLICAARRDRMRLFAGIPPYDHNKHKGDENGRIHTL